MTAIQGSDEPPSTPSILRNIEGEATVLAGLMFDSSRADRLADVLAPADFAEPLFGRIYSVALDLVAQGRPANPVIIAPMFDADPAFAEMEGRKFLGGLVGSLTAAADPVPMARHLRELAVRRQLHGQMLASAQAFADLGVGVDLTIAEHDTAVTSSFERTDPAPMRSGVDVMNEVLNSFDRKVVGVTSGGGVEGVDRLIGSIRPGWLGVVAGRPGMGKTAAFISYLLASASQGHASLFASLEMTWEMLSMRMVADYCHRIGRPVPFSAITGGMTTPDQRRVISGAYDDIAGLPFRIIDKRCHTLGQLRRAIRRRKRELKAQGKLLELVVVDYLQLLMPDQPGKSEYENVSIVSRELKIMAGDENVAIVALSQLSRNVEQRQDKRPQLSDLRASGQIEQDADFVLFLVSQEYYLRKAEPEAGTAEHDTWVAGMAKVESWLEFICAKHRHGQEGNFFGRFFRQLQAVR